jgi:hypothetical protein
MLVGKIDVELIDHLRAEVTNVAAPVLAALSRPASSISNGLENIRALMYLREENARLLEENTKLRQWVYVARRLHTENTALQSLLHSVADPKPKFVTARIIAGTMGSISNTFVINSGSEDGVRKGQPVLSDKGFVGRIIAVSKNSARILLATDINSRIPVILESTRTRALMVGRNMERPRLTISARVRVDSRITGILELISVAKRIRAEFLDTAIIRPTKPLSLRTGCPFLTPSSEPEFMTNVLEIEPIVPAIILAVTNLGLGSATECNRLCRAVFSV